MRAHRPSTTAMAVAWLRGLASLPGTTPPLLDDPLAERLLPRRAAAALRRIGRAARAMPATRDVVTRMLDPLASHIALRTFAIDDETRTAAASGIRQIVLVGAGLDARAWRLPELAGATVYEIDHPATQMFKMRKAADLPTPHALVRFVSVDFERESLGDKLGLAGHDPDAPSLWIWEGVTPYLYPDATRATLDALRARSAPGSRLVVSFALPALTNLPPILLRPVRALFNRIGEDLHGVMPEPDFVALVEERGFHLRKTSGARDWARDARRPCPPTIVEERLAFAGV